MVISFNNYRLGTFFWIFTCSTGKFDMVAFDFDVSNELKENKITIFIKFITESIKMKKTIAIHF